MNIYLNHFLSVWLPGPPCRLPPSWSRTPPSSRAGRCRGRWTRRRGACWPPPRPRRGPSAAPRARHHYYHVITQACGDLNMLRVLLRSGTGRLGAQLPCMWPAPEREHCQLQRPPPHGMVSVVRWCYFILLFLTEECNWQLVLMQFNLNIVR